MCASDALSVPFHPLTCLSASPPPSFHRPSPPVSTADCPPSHHPRFGHVQAIDSLLTPQSGFRACLVDMTSDCYWVWFLGFHGFRGKAGVRGGQN